MPPFTEILAENALHKIPRGQKRDEQDSVQSRLRQIPTLFQGKQKPE